uniref:N-acetylated-alpha-linked acidic dipeptidase 2 n=1 Tax=Globodera pallida TaxID=36090 RepID=A0A183CBP7_GLOPA
MENIVVTTKTFGGHCRRLTAPIHITMTPNKVHSWNERLQRWELVSDGVGRPPKLVNLHPELKAQLSDDPRLHYWWNAYSDNGTVLGELIYANYGTQEDFELLEKWNISVEGKIVLIRYGSIFRGEKIRLAEERGAVGVILFADPFDYVPGNKTFPDDPFLPALAAQRGTIYRGTGDPEGILPRIVVISIGYANAHKLLYRMDGPVVPWSRWAGALPVPYRLTGSQLVRMDVWTRTERRPIRNFVAVMRGREEPDRWVMVGNHADAWTKGSIDPGTGTSIMLEMARVLSNYAAQTEFGLIGSTEWVEQNLRSIQKRGIAYINVDNLNGNNTLVVKSVPLLYRLIADAASKIDQPVKSELKSGRSSLLDAWRFHNPRPSLPGDRSIPHIQPPHSGSDFQPFIAYAGIPVADLRMESAPHYSYMLYHTAYEVPWLNDNFVDPEGNTSVAMGQLWLEIARNLAENMIIPFNVEDYGIALNEYITKADIQMRLISIDKAINVEVYNERLEFLNKSVKLFRELAVEFQRIIHAINNGDRQVSLLQREQFNQRLQSLEQCFILDNGISADRSAFRHVIFSAPEETSNTGLALSVLLDPASKWLSAQRRFNRTEADHRLDKIQMAFSLLQFCVECAVETLTFDE